jgi:PIN domain nuclease of toxin-antitoxin system
MQLLLDTHILLWALVDDKRLSKKARELILAERNSVWVSAATIWEIGIKHALGRGEMPLSAQQAIKYCDEAGYQWLDIRPLHATNVEKLPPIHADPFDRMLIAQAIAESMKLLTHDTVLAQYGSDVMNV